MKLLKKNYDARLLRASCTHYQKEKQIENQKLKEQYWKKNSNKKSLQKFFIFKKYIKYSCLKLIDWNNWTIEFKRILLKETTPGN